MSDSAQRAAGFLDRLRRRGRGEMDALRRVIHAPSRAAFWETFMDHRCGEVPLAVFRLLGPGFPITPWNREYFAPVDAVGRFLGFCRTHREASTAQLFQDLFVLFLFQEKRGGFFVEFGAADGVYLSNTWLLEKRYGWSGILAEPARAWREELPARRTAALDFRCVWAESGKNFAFAEPPRPELSGLCAGFSERDGHLLERRGVREYEVETVSLHDLLEEHGAPRRIDYLSIDTEGSEYDILARFDFSAWDVAVITVEHNGVQDRREAIRRRLAGRGYLRVFEEISLWDDWYVQGEFGRELGLGHG